MSLKTCMNVWCKPLQTKKADAQGRGIPERPLFVVVFYIPSTKVSSTWGSSRSLYSEREYFPLNSAQS